MKYLTAIWLCWTVLHSVNGDLLADQFLNAVPLHPTVKIPDVIVDDMDDYKLEVQTDFAGTFTTYEGCTSNRSNLEVYELGTITTPNYPSRYPARTKCEWFLRSPPGTHIEATIFDLSTQPWFFAYFDYVMIAKDGNFSKVDRLGGDLNRRTPMTISSVGNEFGVRFVSSLFFNYRGMKLQYLVVPDETNAVKQQPSPFDQVCGQSPLLHSDEKGREDLDEHIIGPDTAEPGTFPWQAAMLIDGRSFCGGSIIDDQHILTAAHCTNRAKKITVLVGAQNIKASESSEPHRRVFNITRKNIFQHPEYNENTISHDITVIRLPEKITFNKYVSPICLPNRFYLGKTFVGESVRVSGWGKPADYAPGISPELKNTTVEVMSNAECRTMFRSLVTGNLICTATKFDASPCRGDSGGPLVVKQQDSNGQPFFMQVGIVSFGGRSCQRAYPVGFTRVTAFMSYISSITGKPI